MVYQKFVGQHAMVWSRGIALIYQILQNGISKPVMTLVLCRNPNCTHKAISVWIMFAARLLPPLRL
jgi:hypothetical protein